MKILVAGSRLWEDEKLVREALNEAWKAFGAPADVELIHGNDPTGADMMSDKIATERGWKLTVFKPDWNTDGKQAYDVRNEAMLDYGADIGLVFFSRRSPKPLRIIEGLDKRGIPHFSYWSEEELETENPSE